MAYEKYSYVGPPVSGHPQALEDLFYAAMDDGIDVAGFGGLGLATATAHELREMGVEGGQSFVEEVRDKHFDIMLEPEADLADIAIGLGSTLSDWLEGRTGALERVAIAHDLAMSRGLYTLDIEELVPSGEPGEMWNAARVLSNALIATEALIEQGFAESYEADGEDLSSELAQGYDKFVELLDSVNVLDGNFVPSTINLWERMHEILSANLPEKFDTRTRGLLERVLNAAEMPHADLPDLRKAGLKALINLQANDPDRKRYKKFASHLAVHDMTLRFRPRFDRDQEERELFCEATKSSFFGPARIRRDIILLARIMETSENSDQPPVVGTKRTDFASDFHHS